MIIVDKFHVAFKKQITTHEKDIVAHVNKQNNRPLIFLKD